MVMTHLLKKPGIKDRINWIKPGIKDRINWIKPGIKDWINWINWIKYELRLITFTLAFPYLF